MAVRAAASAAEVAGREDVGAVVGAAGMEAAVEEMVGEEAEEGMAEAVSDVTCDYRRFSESIKSLNDFMEPICACLLLAKIVSAAHLSTCAELRPARLATRDTGQARSKSSRFGTMLCHTRSNFELHKSLTWH